MKSILNKILLLVVVTFSVVLATCANEPEKTTHRIMSCNIRVALPDDSVKGFGWNDRKDVCIEIIKKYNADVICTQEVLKVQFEDLSNALPDYYGFGFVGPEMDKYPVGYHGIAKNVIFFSKKRYQLVSAGNYWLSETPHIGGSQSWGTARARHCNWVRLKDTYTGKEFRVMDIHLDHISQEAKEAQIKMILDEAKQYQEDFPQFLVGDFNANAQKNVIKMIRNSGWTDTSLEVNGKENPRSHHGFKGRPNDAGDSGCIDFIFSYGPVKSLKSELIKDQIDGKYPSDHYFLMADVEIK